MAKIVIDIPDLDYFDIRHGYADNYQRDRLVESVKCSIAIPKGHGRLIDADNMKRIDAIQMGDFNSIESIRKWIDIMPTVIEADKEVENEGNR